ncbi:MULTISPECIES: ABC transporter permease [Streptomyces]|uniref:Transport permease protein n=1 Tax=Streptomyces cacaoi TaxID=1898 RepID=A0A4Y3QYT9_STRCI|nr:MULTISPECIES: ABC transporter permease [Streptomyces]NNG83902.1 ABC transporter permease [Streptomyces cacaoi]QHF93768.1 ABC transporter permease [Streptomyces sp. NHF165]GEB50129.1 transport permease protein [Streptomyces cacaoi]
MSTATVKTPRPAGSPGPDAGTPPVKPGVDEGRIGLRANLRHIGALVRRNALQIKQDPESMMDALLMPIVFTLLFVYVFGGAIGGGKGGSRDDYVQYLVPGMMGMMSMSIAMAVGTGINEDFRKGVMDRFRSMPIARSSVLIAKSLVEVGRMLVAIIVLLTVGILVGFDVNGHWLGMLGAIGLTALFGSALLWVFIIVGLTMRTAQAVQGISFLVLMPLQFGSSVFVPTGTMPGWLKAFTDVNPLTHVADSARGLMLGQGEVGSPVMWTVIWSVGLTLATAPFAIAMFRKKT